MYTAQQLQKMLGRCYKRHIQHIKKHFVLIIAILSLANSLAMVGNYNFAYASSGQILEPKNNTHVYGCSLYESPISIERLAIHCDPLHNVLEGHVINGTAKLIYSSPETLIPSMIFAPDGRLFFTEKSTGAIRIMKDDKVLDTPFVEISNVHSPGEQGMLGLTLDPDFEENHYLYLYYTYRDDNGQPFNRVVRFTDDHDKGTEMTILLDKIPASVSPAIHSGGAMAFGPDEKLYVTVGDNFEAESAQDPTILTGKILRINRDGTVPKDNPWFWDNNPSKVHNNEVLDEDTFVSFVASTDEEIFRVVKDSAIKKINETSIRLVIDNDSSDVSLYRDYFEKEFDFVGEYEGKGRDWSQYNYLTLWMNGSSDNSAVGIRIRDIVWNDRNEEYMIRNNFTGWKFFTIPLKATYPTMNFSAVRGIEFVFHKGWDSAINLDGVYLGVSTDPFAERKNYSYNSPAYTNGHRNMFGIAFNNEGLGIVTENGPSFYDEINKIEKGGNYGWPMQHSENAPADVLESSIKPLRRYWNTIVPAQAIYYDSDKIPELKDKFIFAAFTGIAGNLYTLKFDKHSNIVIKEEIISTNHTGVVASLAQSPDGSIYFGGSHIHRLERVNDSMKQQFLFPIEIIGNIEIRILGVIEDEKKLYIDMQVKEDASEISLKIPKMLLDGIVAVRQGNKDLDFMVEPAGDYNILNARLISNKPLTIVGSTVIPEFPVSGIVMTLFIFSLIFGTILNKRRHIA